MVKRLSSMTYNQIRRRGIKLSPYGDIDKDGVINSKDCRPFNPKKQGWMHDLQMKRLQVLEAKLERKRIKALKNLEDTKEKMQKRRAVMTKYANVKNANLAAKQAVIDEIKKERQKIANIKSANARLKKDMQYLSFSANVRKTVSTKIARTKKKSDEVIKKTKAFLNKKETQTVIKRVDGILNRIAATKL